MKILYIEDDPIDAELIRGALARLAPDIAVEVITNLTVARQRLENISGVDAVLCDLTLPDGSGMEVLGHIRSRNLPLAVVILTGTGDQEAVSAALKAGADAYLIKGKYSVENLPGILARAMAHFHSAAFRRARPIRVLYAEDNAADANLTRRHLAQHAPHIQLQVAAEAQGVLDRFPVGGALPPDIDVVLLDYLLPGCNALDLVRILRSERGVELPIVLVTGQGSEEVAAEALFLGVDDYLVKSEGYLHKLPATIESNCHRADLLRERISLQESETRARLLLDSAAEAIYGVDIEGTCTFVNPACLRILGYDRAEELIGRRIHDLIHHTHADGSPYPAEECLIYRAYLRDEAIHRDDEVFWRKDGQPVPVEYWSYPMHRDGRVVGSVATFFDITERRRAEEKLRQAAMVFDNTRDGVMVTDVHGYIQAVNQAFSKITGYGEDDVLHKRPNILRSGRHDPAFYQAMWKSIEDTGYWQGEIWNRRKNGEVYPQWLTISRVDNGHGVLDRCFVGVFTDLSQIRFSEERLDHLVHHDPLTDLPNRSLLQLRLAHALERARRNGGRIGVLYIDLDHFKTVNDSLGHKTGDGLLLAVVDRLGARVRKEDTLGRLGGDEFMLVLESMQESQAAADVARDLLSELAAPFSCSGGHEVYLGASIGISVFPDDGGDVAELMRDAEVAMYRAKDRGRGRFCFYTADMNADALAILELEADLRRALDRGEFTLHYQPKVDLNSGLIVGAEALLRWARNGEAVPPSRFIPLAEKTGLIVPIGAWVVETACRQIRIWHDMGFGNARVAVNVSALQFRAEDFEDTVAQALERFGVPLGHLELELTESMLMEEPEAATRLLGRFKSRGVRLSLDDFGTGYSSLAYLSRLPIDILKIDQSFVRDIVTEPDSAGIVAAVIGLAQRMRLKVVAEGVETEAQLAYLRKQGCDQMQGFLFSRPVPAEMFTEMLRENRALPVVEIHGTEQRTLLLVDDEPNILTALRRMLRNEGYRILTAGSAHEGLDLLARNTVQVILSDQRMPGMSGTEFLGRVKDLHPDTVRIVLSGFTELDTIIQAVNQGAIYKFLIKPWEDELMRAHIRDAFRYHEAVVKPRERDREAAQPAGQRGAA